MTRAHSITPEQILETLPQPIFTVDHGLCITYFNKAAERLTGVPKDQALGVLYTDVLETTFGPGGCPLYLAIETGKPYLNLSGMLIRTAKQEFKAQVSTSPLRDVKGIIVGSVAIMQRIDLDLSDDSSIQNAVQACEVQSIITALQRNNNNRTAAARDLGIHKSTFFRKIKKMGIDLPHIDGRFRNKPSSLE